MSIKTTSLLVAGLVVLSTLSYGKPPARENRENRPGQTGGQPARESFPAGEVGQRAYEAEHQRWLQRGSQKPAEAQESLRLNQDRRGLRFENSSAPERTNRILEEAVRQGPAAGTGGVRNRAGRPAGDQGGVHVTAEQALSSAGRAREARREEIQKLQLTPEQREIIRKAVKEREEKGNRYKKAEEGISKESLKTYASKYAGVKEYFDSLPELLKEFPEAQKTEVMDIIKAMVMEHENLAANGHMEFNLAEIKSQISNFLLTGKDALLFLPKDGISGHPNLAKNFLRNLMSMYHRNPAALKFQIDQIKSFVDITKDPNATQEQKEAAVKEVEVIIRGLALTAESFGETFAIEFAKGKSVHEAHETARKAMGEFLRRRGLTPEELKEFDENCFQGTDMSFLALANGWQ